MGERLLSSWLIASRPPAEAPRATTGNFFLFSALAAGLLVLVTAFFFTALVLVIPAVFRPQLKRRKNYRRRIEKLRGIRSLEAVLTYNYQIYFLSESVS